MNSPEISPSPGQDAKPNASYIVTQLPTDQELVLKVIPMPADCNANGDGLNLAVGDLDQPADGGENFGHFRHEQWWAGAPHTRTQKNNCGTLRLMGARRR